MKLQQEALCLCVFSRTCVLKLDIDNIHPPNSVVTEYNTWWYMGHALLILPEFMLILPGSL